MRFGRGENILEFLFEMDRETLERHYVIPHLKRTINFLNRHDFKKDRDVLKVLKVIFPKVHLKRDDGLVIMVEFGHAEGFGILLGLAGLYPGVDPFDIISRQFRKPLETKILEKMIASRSTRKLTEHSTPSLELLFSPKSADWLSETDLHKYLRQYAAGLVGLLQQIEARSDSPSSQIKERFRDFKTD
jgi:hypothetical protein